MCDRKQREVFTMNNTVISR